MKYLKKVLMICGLLIIVGQIFFSTNHVLADKTPSFQQLSKEKGTTEQKEGTQLVKNTYESSQDISTPLLISKETEDSNEANAPPQLEGTLTTDKDGNILYDGEKIFYEDGKVPANMENLFKKGVSAKLMARSAAPAIEYLGPITWGYHTVGEFLVNGKIAFCIQHPLPTPPTGTPNNGFEAYDNEKIKSVLYWGWGGPKNIFTDKNAGIVATSLALSYFYYGDGPYNSLPDGYDTLIEKANADDAPDHQLQLDNTNNLVKLNVTFDGKTQRSETVKLNGDTKNSITFSLGTKIKYVNETTGKTATSGNVTVNGEESFHFEADAVTKETLKKENLQGTIQGFQPLLVKPTSGQVQTLGTWKWYDDPAQTVSFEVNFIERTGNLIGKKLDKTTKEALPNFEFDVTFDGKTQRVKTNAKGEFKVPDIIHNTKGKVKEVFAPAPYVLDPDNQEKEFTITASKDFTVEFKNEKATGKTTIVKEDLTTDSSEPLNPNYPLAGAKYGLFKEDGTLVEEFDLGESLTATKDKLELGMYYWQETVPPVGYTKDFKKHFVDLNYVDMNTPVVVNDGKSQDDVIRMNFDFQKLIQNSTNEMFKNGVEFTMTNLRTKDTTVVTTETVDGKKGYAAFNDLPLDDYRLTETKGVEGYQDIKPILIKHTYDKETGTFNFIVSDEETGNVLNEESYTQEKLSDGVNVDLGTFVLKDKAEKVEEPKFNMSSEAYIGEDKKNVLIFGSDVNLSDKLTMEHKNMKAGTKRAYENILVAVGKDKDGKTEEKDVWTSGKIDYEVEGDGNMSFDVVSDYNHSEDKTVTKYYFKVNVYSINDKGDYVLEHEHNKDGKEEAQSIDVIYPKVTIGTQAHTGNGVTNTFTWGDKIKFYDDVTIGHENIIDGTERAFETILVAVYPEETKADETTSSKEKLDDKKTSSSSEGIKETSSSTSSSSKEESTKSSASETKDTSSTTTSDSKSTDYKLASNEKEVWTSGKIDYKVTDKEITETVLADYDYTQDPKGTRYYFKEIGYKKTGDKEYEEDTNHNLDGKEKTQALIPIEEKEESKKPSNELPQTGTDGKRMIGLCLLILGVIVTVGGIFYYRKSHVG